MNHESLVEKYLGITNYETEKISLPLPRKLVTEDTNCEQNMHNNNNIDNDNNNNNNDNNCNDIMIQ